jgi:predicted AlkP superfamily pyrophosphatase or phosphodiesterase
MRKLFTLLFICSCLLIHAQEQPKLVIGIVVDQMTNEYLYRFAPEFSEGGFHRLLNGGYYFPNTFLNYQSTSTAPGHASIYTGSTPSSHGIVENIWLDLQTNKAVYCVDDASVKDLNNSGESGMKSPHQLVGATITDMLSLNTLSVSKVVSLAIKDRAAILPGGHTADLALWWDSKTGKWTSSSYYSSTLPSWLNVFNEKHPASSYLSNWNIDYQTRGIGYAVNHEVHEQVFEGSEMQNNYDLKALSEQEGIGILKSTPFGNTYTLDLAKEVLLSESFGKDNITDFLCISFSSTDYIGHRFGPYSAEVLDTYKRLDVDLATFLLFLDERIGKEKYLLFLTADHGVMPNGDFLLEMKFPAKSFNLKLLKDELNSRLNEKFKLADLVLSVDNGQVYLDHLKIEQAHLDVEKIAKEVTDILLEDPAILSALSSHDLLFKNFEDFPQREMQLSYYKGRSGDVLYTRKPFMRSDEYSKGTGHGTPYVYDRNVPLIFYGMNVMPGTSYENVEITQIAATLADLLHIQRPPFCTAESLMGKLVK